MTSKSCSKCKEEKTVSKFRKNKSLKDGLTIWCKECIADYNARWRRNNIDRIRKTEQDWRDNNREKKNQANKDHYKKNKEYHVKYRADNIEHKRAYYRDYKKKRYAEDGLFNVRQRLSSVIKTALKRRGYSKTSKSAEILGADYDTVWAHLQKTWKDKYGADLQNTDVYNIHHVVYCNTATNEEELVKLQHYENLVLVTPEDHIDIHRTEVIDESK